MDECKQKQKKTLQPLRPTIMIISIKTLQSKKKNQNDKKNHSE